MRALEGLPETYHSECWVRDRVRVVSVVKPQSRRPWVMVWYAVFPNSDVVAILESPQEDYDKLMNSRVLNVEDYRQIILDSEAALELGPEAVGVGIAARKFDPAFTEDLKPGVSPMARLSNPCEKCARKCPREDLLRMCPHRLHYSAGSTDGGIELLRAAIGADGDRPKLYAIAANCPNYCRAKSEFAYPETEDGEPTPSEPDGMDKDFVDLDLVLYNAKLDHWPEVREALPMRGPRKLFTPPGFHDGKKIIR